MSMGEGRVVGEEISQAAYLGPGTLSIWPQLGAPHPLRGHV